MPEKDPPQKAASDQHLLDALTQSRGGCDKAFASLQRSTRRGVWAAIARIVGPNGDVEDLLQDSYLKAWLHLDAFDERRGGVAAWLGTIARHTAVDHLRRRSAQPSCVSPRDEDQGPYDAFESNEASPYDCLVRARTRSAVHECLANLTVIRRDSIIQAFFNDLSHSELATLNRRPLGSIKSEIRRSLMQLRPALSNHEP